jgi:hypothetical protein
MCEVRWIQEYVWYHDVVIIRNLGSWPLCVFVLKPVTDCFLYLISLILHSNECFQYHCVHVGSCDFSVRFQLLTVVSMKMAVCWVVVLYSLIEVYWCFRGAGWWCPDDSGSKHHWNASKHLLVYSAQQLRRQLSLYVFSVTFLDMLSLLFMWTACGPNWRFEVHQWSFVWWSFHQY